MSSRGWRDAAFGPVVALCAAGRTQVNAALADREPWHLVVGTAGCTLAAVWLWSQLHHEEGVSNRLKKRIFRLARLIPSIHNRIEEERRRMLTDSCAQMTCMNEGVPYTRVLPERGMSRQEVLDSTRQHCSLGQYAKGELYLSGTVYNGSAELTELMTQVYSMAAWSNPLHPDVFPGIRKMEAEVVRMCCDLFQGGPDSCGSMTSGGTESIIMAMKTCRDLGREERGITRPEVLVPVTAHAAFDKGAHLLRVKITHIAVDPETSRVRVSEMKRHINRNTVMLVCSAPAFPHGNIDPIQDVAALGLRYQIPVHVDACLGGFLLPFMAEAGYYVVPFDFSVPGVTSISADPHKYAFTPKGSSLVMYCSQKLRHYQYFVQPDWPGGIYASPSMAGSRAGVVVAACWATFMYFGRARYVEMTRKIIETTGFIERECSLVPGLRVQGCCDVSVVALASDVFNIYRLSDAMAGRGWSLNALQRPPSFHVAVTYPLTADGVPQKFVSDIAELTEEILLTPMQDTGSHAAMYGMSAGVPDRSLVSELAWCFLDGTYTTADVAENCDVMGSKSDGDVTENGSGEGRKMTHGDFGGRKDKVDYEQTNNKANILNGTARTNGLN